MAPKHKNIPEILVKANFLTWFATYYLLGCFCSIVQRIHHNNQPFKFKICRNSVGNERQERLLKIKYYLKFEIKN